MSPARRSPASAVRAIATSRYFELVCVLVLLVAFGSWWFAPQDDGRVELPLQFRINKKALSDLPVSISEPRSCSCWSGGDVERPDGSVVHQISTRYRFAIHNGSRTTIAIEGGEESVIRLLVAYPKRRTWSGIAVPGDLIETGTGLLRKSSYRTQPSKRNPIEDADVYVAKNFYDMTPSLVENGADYGIPPDYDLWAVPSTLVWSSANYEATAADPFAGSDAGSWTHTTAVDPAAQTLFPDHTYDDPRRGWSSWSFQLPVSAELAGSLARDPSKRPDPAMVRRALIPVGVAALVPSSDGRSTDLLGFAPVLPAGRAERDDF